MNTVENELPSYDPSQMNPQLSKEGQLAFIVGGGVSCSGMEEWIPLVWEASNEMLDFSSFSGRYVFRTLPGKGPALASGLESIREQIEPLIQKDLQTSTRSWEYIRTSKGLPIEDVEAFCKEKAELFVDWMIITLKDVTQSPGWRPMDGFASVSLYRLEDGDWR